MPASATHTHTRTQTNGAPPLQRLHRRRFVCQNKDRALPPATSPTLDVGVEIFNSSNKKNVNAIKTHSNKVAVANNSNNCRQSTFRLSSNLSRCCNASPRCAAWECNAIFIQHISRNARSQRMEWAAMLITARRRQRSVALAESENENENRSVELEGVACANCGRFLATK